MGRSGLRDIEAAATINRQRVFMNDHILERRRFLKFIGLSSAGITTAAAIAASREKISDGSDLAKAEIENLKQAYEDLDKRSKLILRLILAMSGLDIFLAL